MWASFRSTLEAVWSTSNEDVEDDDDDSTGDEDDDKELAKELYLEEQLLGNEWRNGTVTRQEDDYRILDGRYFWPKELSPKIATRAGGRVRVGDEVRYRVEKRTENAEWKVVEIERVSAPSTNSIGINLIKCIMYYNATFSFNITFSHFLYFTCIFTFMLLPFSLVSLTKIMFLNKYVLSYCFRRLAR